MNNYTLRMKMVMAFFLTSFIIFIVNVFMYVNINTMVKELDKVYESNVELNDLNEALTNVQTSLTKYLNTKSSDSMEEYFRCEQEFTELVNNLNGKIYDESSMILEKNIKSLEKSERDTIIFMDSMKNPTWIPFICAGFSCLAYLVIAIMTSIDGIIQMI